MDSINRRLFKIPDLEDGPGIPSLPLECLKKALEQMQLRKVDDTEPWRPFTVELMT